MTIVDRHPPGNVTWIDLASGDPEGSRRFYGSLFDWTFDIGGAETGHYAMCKLGGKNVAGLGGKPPGVEMPTAWTPYLAVADLDATLARVTEAGGAIAMPVMDIMDQGRMAVITDPTGGALGLWQAKLHNGMQRVAEPGSFAWTELNTRDMKRAAEFFTKVFGYTAKKLEGGMEYTTLHRGDDTIAGLLQMDKNWPAEVPPHWMVYFAVDDVDRTLEKVKSLGGKVCVPPFDSPYGRISVIEDPQGGMVSLIKTTFPA